MLKLVSLRVGLEQPSLHLVGLDDTQRLLPMKVISWIVLGVWREYRSARSVTD